MGWVRRHKTHGVILALISLALQIALTSAHVHLRGLSVDAVRAHRVAVAQSSSPLPAQNPDQDEYCAICASIFLASSVFAASPPPLLVPANFQPIEHSLIAASPLFEPVRLAFRSRAPPTV